MAKKTKDTSDNKSLFSQSSSGESRSFDEGLERNSKHFHVKDSQWTYARNAINNSNIGDLGKLGNEPGNLLCITVPNGYTIIGTVHIEADKYAIYSTNNNGSEIGYFEEDTCSYTTIVNDRCLNFKTSNLIYGVSRETSECNHVLYWDDGLNPSRVLNIGDIRKAPYPAPWPNVPWKCVDVLPGPCIDCEPIGPPYILDCDRIRLAPLMDPLCMRVEKANNGGSLQNGSYFVVGAYTIKGERMTDYFPPSNLQPVFDHIGVGGSITIFIENADTSYFDEFELVVVYVVAQQTMARKVGIYSTRTQQISLDVIDNQLPSVPLDFIPVRNQVYDKSDAMYTVNDYLLRVGPTTKLDFNYQPLANQIVTKWQSVEYEADYYRKGGNKTGYMRDEVYSFFIRFVYDTGDRSASYHIPGRPTFNIPVQNPGLSNPPFFETDLAPVNDDHYEQYAVDELGNPKYDCDAFVWEVYNTAWASSPRLNPPVYIDNDDGDCETIGRGVVVQEGYMGYWESTEKYPDNKPDVWNSDISVAPYPYTYPGQYDLCGKAIRHHRFPDNDFSLNSTIFDATAGCNNDPQKIRIMGVKFENILPPRVDPFDPNSPLVPGVKCFEILRGSRKGNRTVIAKGIINNMVEYDIPDNISNQNGLFQNYPYNDLRGDEFLSTFKTRWKGFSGVYGYYSQKTGQPLTGNANYPGTHSFTESQYLKDYFSFHSPETTFSNPFLASRELKVYQEIDGRALMQYQFVPGHPRHKMMTDLAWLMAGIAGLGVAALAAGGKVIREWPVGVLGRNGWEQWGLNILAGYYGFGVEALQALGLGATPYPITAGAQQGLYIENTSATSISPVFSFLYSVMAGGAPIFSYYWMTGAEETFRFLRNAVSYQQYALRQMSHCFYDNSVSCSLGRGLNPRTAGQRRRYINDSGYIDNQIQDFTNRKINNLYRSKYVAINIQRDLSSPYMVDYTRKDTSLKHLTNQSGPFNINPPFSFGNPNSGVPVAGQASPPAESFASANYFKNTYLYKNPETTFQRDSSTYYASLKQRIKNQYGQLNNITQLPITICPNCCIGEGSAQQLVINPNFNSGLSGWTSINWSLSGQGNPPQGAQTSGQNVPNSLSQPVNWIAGQQYTFCFDIIQLDQAFNIGVSFNSSAPNSYYATYNSSGNYCITVTALASWDEIRFTQYSVGGCFNTWPVSQTCFTPLPTPSLSNTNTLRSNSTYAWSAGQVSEFIDLRLALPAPASGNNNLGVSPGSTAGPIILNPGGAGERGSVQQRRTRGISGGCGPVSVPTTSFINGVPGSLLDYNSIQSGYFEGNGEYCIDVTWDVDITNASTVCESSDCAPYQTNMLAVYLAVFKPGGVAPYTGSLNLPYGVFSRLVGTIMAAPNSGCQGNFPITPTTSSATSPNFVTIQGVTYYQMFFSGFGGITPGSYGTTCQIPNLNLQPGWKVIPYIYSHGITYAASFCIKPITYRASVIDNVTITRQGCDGSSIGPLFGGDIYINRYTEKNTFFYFYDWLFKQPDGSYLDYSKYQMLPYPTYWVNTDDFDVGEGIMTLQQLINPFNLIPGMVQAGTSVPATFITWLGWLVAAGGIIATGGTPPPFPPPVLNVSIFQNLINNLKTPSDYHVLDRPTGFPWADFNGLLSIGIGGYDIGFVIKYGYFYLFNSGVRDFYVESEYNVAYRDWEDVPEKRHYDYKTYTSLPDLFYTDIIKSGNYYKYDLSLSISKNWFSYVAWGNTQQRSYDPALAETCYVYRPDRIIYSLQQQYESIKDNWRLFLANNYKDFLSRVNSVKQINKSGVIVLLQSDSPLMFQGLDQLQTDLGTKLTIGDGGLFSQPQQAVINSERAFEYASCQNRLSVVNTPFGVFWINQNQGKIFQMQGGVNEISMKGLKWWLSKYLPYKLTAYFPNFLLTDNPIVGIGCQTVYDNQNNIIYFTKRDYKPKLNPDGDPIVSYDPEGDRFYIPGFQVKIKLGDPAYFENASWTISYDLKTKEWISYHDWYPDLTVSSKNTFMTTKGGGIWIHNKRCDLYTNYYGIDYPFEIEYLMDTIQTVNTLRSIEYQLEVYKYNTENCYDRFHVLDFNFDAAIVYNTEQCSGTLKLNLSPKNNAPAIIGYPFYNTATVANEILYSKEENKYRFNQFYDITRDRGEFDFFLYPETNPANGPIEANASSVSPVNPDGVVPGGQQAGSYAVQPIWSTGPEGYIKNLNLNNLNYGKSQLQRKKFRHYTSSVLLRRTVSGDKKMLVSIANHKNLFSPR